MVKNSKGIDHWGYYNGGNPGSAIASQEISLLVKDSYGWSQQGSLLIGDIDKNPSSSSQNGLLKSITFPTGRKSTFHYEQNQYKTYNEIKPTGGNRISMIEEYEPVNDVSITRRFKYGIDEDGAGKINHEISLDDYMLEYFNYFGMFNQSGTYDRSDITRVRIYSSTPFSDPSYQNGAIAHYEHVTEYIDGKGKIEYVYKKSNFHTRRISGTTMVINGESEWSGGELLQKTEYGYNPENDEYYPVSKEKNQYEMFGGNSIPYGMSYYNVRKKFPDYEHAGGEAQDFQSLGAFPYETSSISTGSKKLKQQEIETFNGGDSVTQVIVYNYDNRDHMYLTRQTVFGNLSAVTTTYKYPQDMTFSDPTEEAGRTGLIDNNILSPVLLSERTESGKQWITKVKHTYMPSTTIPMAVSLEEGLDLNELYTKQSIEIFDKIGNPAQITDNSKNTVYIWGYGGHKLIPEIQNAVYSEVSLQLGQTRIDRLLNSLSPDQTDLDALNNLREQLPYAFITTIQYKPSAGISCVIDPAKKTTTYEYDSFNRLCKIKDHEGKIMEEYTYNYRNK